MDDIRKAGKEFSQPTKELNEQLALITTEQFQWRYDYMEKNSTVVSYYSLVRDLMNIDDNTDMLAIIF